ncbi:hypothetical protein KL86DPRO_11335 [uncultured delta proteobacterium]|uniref:Uncharacterized protein n=1 Tax=uncultured delta proteobacterium TaxID=34034 RepID=A0A212JFU6_9DELT|nr:hypothetical protein KL86DPRO_11335 [uncultured delta proteobacterium]
MTQQAHCMNFLHPEKDILLLVLCEKKVLHGAGLLITQLTLKIEWVGILAGKHTKRLYLMGK